ncbi:hypothetical protein [Extibacter sp. GGCC_0201]|uniref:hypothetical protein n=1 Tax=Extibacter sp. GGCC_0201 TaxID=2731209 RepID=UPI001AA0E506|nr:hypothetical protein [Extibacter sp. GGCC_0201]MBO1722758.1 hypothetical protein [Extibacter sp. GGCC_0201]
MKKMKFMSVLALAAMISITITVPALAAGTAEGKTQVTYTANSAAPDLADWMVSFPSKVTLTDYNTEASKGQSLNFELLDKLSGQAYGGSETVTVSVAGYGDGFDMTGGSGGSAKMGLANGSKTELAGPDFELGSMKAKVGTGKENVATGYAYLKSTTNPEGTFTKTVTFTFKDGTT